MKHQNILFSILLGIAVTANVALAGTSIVALSEEEMAHYGATHAINVDFSDLASCTTSNQTIAFTNNVTAPCSVRFSGYQLDAPFGSTTITNATFNIALSFGDTNSTTRWISGVQAAWNQTPTVYYSFGTGLSVSGGSNTVAVLTDPNLNAQTSTVQLVLTVAQSGAGSYSMSNLTYGHARFFVRIGGQKYRY